MPAIGALDLLHLCGWESLAEGRARPEVCDCGTGSLTSGMRPTGIRPTQSSSPWRAE
jgi:hypothetical protein